MLLLNVLELKEWLKDSRQTSRNEDIKLKTKSADLSACERGIWCFGFANAYGDLKFASFRFRGFVIFSWFFHVFLNREIHFYIKNHIFIVLLSLFTPSSWGLTVAWAANASESRCFAAGVCRILEFTLWLLLVFNIRRSPLCGKTVTFAWNVALALNKHGDVATGVQYIATGMQYIATGVQFIVTGVKYVATGV